MRFVGDPATRIAEDYLRILRFFRFHARYAAGPPDAAAVAAIRAGVPGLARLSAERVWSELTRILAAPDPRGAVALMAELGVLAAVIPEGADPAAAGPAWWRRARRPIPLLRLAALLTGDAEAFAARLRLSTAERERLVALRDAPLARPDADDAALRRLLAEADPAVLLDRTWLDGGSGPEWAALRARLAAMPRPVFPLEGRDVLALGLPPGPRCRGVAARGAGLVAGGRLCRRRGGLPGGTGATSGGGEGGLRVRSGTIESIGANCRSLCHGRAKAGMLAASEDVGGRAKPGHDTGLCRAAG